MTDVPVDPPPQGVETPSATAPEEPAAPPAEIAQIPAQAAPPPESRESVATGLQMKHRNPFAVWIGLPLITLGIYTYVWYYKIHREMADFDRRRDIPVAGPMLVLLFLSWTLIAPIISFHNTGKRVRDAQVAAGLDATCSPALSWLLLFAFGANTLYLQFELNKIIDSYHGQPEGAPVSLYV